MDPMKPKVQSLLKPQTEPEITVQLAGKTVTLAQKPHIEADIKAAATVLNRLLDSSTPSTPSITFTSRVIESDG